MVQGVACPDGRPQHTESAPIVDFGPNFVDLSRANDEESEKDIAKSNVELIGKNTCHSAHRFTYEKEFVS